VKGSEGGERRERGTGIKRRRKEGMEWRMGPLARREDSIWLSWGLQSFGWRALLLDICVGAPKFLVTPLLMGPVCLLSQGRFEEPVRHVKQRTTCMS